jgi:hypothetical protein
MPGPAVQVSQVQGLGELPGVHGRGSDVADLPGPDRVVQRLQGFLDRGVVVPAVDLVQVDVVGPQSLQGGVELGEDRLAGQPGAVRAGAHPHPATRARRPGPARRSSCSRAEGDGGDFQPGRAEFDVSHASEPRSRSALQRKYVSVRNSECWRPGRRSLHGPTLRRSPDLAPSSTDHTHRPVYRPVCGSLLRDRSGSGVTLPPNGHQSTDPKPAQAVNQLDG